MSHVALNAHLLSLSQSYRGAGISWYIFNLLQSLPQVEDDLHFTAFLHDRAFLGDGLQTEFSRWSTQRPAMRILWEQLIQPSALCRVKADLYHAMAFVSPILLPCPSVVTVYDLSFLRFPETFRPINRYYLRYLTALSVRRAKAVITISESTRQDVINLLGKPANQVHTVYCGVDDSFRPLPLAEVAQFKQQQNLPDCFIPYVGTSETGKNLCGLTPAYGQLYQLDQTTPPLIVAGGKGWYYQAVFALVAELGLQERVKFPGYVPQTQLPLWYNAASLFVYPSLFEGFGLPVLEAMSCGTPVVTSNVSSLPEVVGQAGVLINPDNPSQLAHTMHLILTQPDLQQTMRARGLQQAAQFRWDKAAQETVAIYQKTIRNFVN
ncbi:glycosyltransferase family 1 protein [Anaerolineales bacterium HSG24]|nr:glycosyltransferase family 1 protein [Anaerolineales bacterium HSG24]